MKVYITLVGHDYEGHELSGVFSTFEAAKEFVDSANRGDVQDIREAIVDEIASFYDWFDWPSVYEKES